MMVTIPENKIASFSAVIGYYKNDGSFVYYNYNEGSDKVLIIDTRTLVTPVISISSKDWSYRKQKGEHIEVLLTPHIQAVQD